MAGVRSVSHPVLRLTLLAVVPLAAMALASASLGSSPPARAASLKGQHEVWYRLTTGQGELQLKESLGHPDGSWRIELSFTVRGPGLSPMQEAALGVWRRLGALNFGVGGTWYARDSNPWDVWATASVPWERP